MCLLAKVLDYLGRRGSQSIFVGIEQVVVLGKLEEKIFKGNGKKSINKVGQFQWCKYIVVFWCGYIC